jgi:hypothetical protein
VTDNVIADIIAGAIFILLNKVLWPYTFMLIKFIIKKLKIRLTDVIRINLKKGMHIFAIMYEIIGLLYCALTLMFIINSPKYVLSKLIVLYICVDSICCFYFFDAIFKELKQRRDDKILDLHGKAFKAIGESLEFVMKWISLKDKQ